MDQRTTRLPTLEDSLSTIINSHLDQVHVALPARVEHYNPPFVDATPTLVRVFLDDAGKEQVSPYPTITDVPVAFPRGGGGFLTFPLKAGDLVLLVFAQRSLDAWLETDGKTPTDPGDVRRHHISDAVAIPGLQTSANKIPSPSTTDVVLGLEDGSASIHIQPGGHVAVNGGTQAVALAPQTEARLSALESFMASHTHVSSFGGGPTTPPAGFSPGAGAVASAKLLTDA